MDAIKNIFASVFNEKNMKVLEKMGKQAFEVAKQKSAGFMQEAKKVAEKQSKELAKKAEQVKKEAAKKAEEVKKEASKKAGEVKKEAAAKVAKKKDWKSERVLWCNCLVFCDFCQIN